MNSKENLHSLPPPAYYSTTTIPVPPPVIQLSKRRILLAKFVQHFSSRRVLIILIVGLILACVELVYGRQYDGQCPYRPQIPLFLTVQGIVKLVSCCTVLIAYAQAKCFLNYQYLYELMLVNIAIHLVFALFFLVWFLFGNVWIWTVDTSIMQSIDPNLTSTYCEDKLYQAAKRLLIVHYVLIGIAILIIVAALVYKRHRKQGITQAEQEIIPEAVQDRGHELQRRW